MKESELPVNDDDFGDEIFDDDSKDMTFDDELMDYEPELAVIENYLDRMMAVASVDAVYGEPIQHGEDLVIPVAEVGAMMGFGIGSGYAENEKQPAGGSGGGGGGWNFSRPVAVIIASPNGVRVEPVVDVTKVGIAALTTFGFMATLALRMLRPRR